MRLNSQESSSTEVDEEPPLTIASPLAPSPPLTQAERASGFPRYLRSRTIDREDLEPGSEYHLTHSRTPARNLEVHDPADWPDDLVDWDGPRDPNNPRNWALRKKVRVTLQLGLTTMGASFASSSFSPTFPILEEVFHVSRSVATLTLSLFVLGL